MLTRQSRFLLLIKFLCVVTVVGVDQKMDIDATHASVQGKVIANGR